MTLAFLPWPPRDGFPLGRVVHSYLSAHYFPIHRVRLCGTICPLHLRSSSFVAGTSPALFFHPNIYDRDYPNSDRNLTLPLNRCRFDRMLSFSAADIQFICGGILSPPDGFTPRFRVIPPTEICVIVVLFGAVRSWLRTWLMVINTPLRTFAA